MVQHCTAATNTGVKRGLVLCTRNSARSQMVDALPQLIADDQFTACSAGTHPVGPHPMAVEVMKELRVDVRHHRSNHISATNSLQTNAASHAYAPSSAKVYLSRPAQRARTE
ncbi:arsenate reductase/protein-tyrosine-phosphatase family protein [Nitrospira sp. Nam80]